MTEKKQVTQRTFRIVIYIIWQCIFALFICIIYTNTYYIYLFCIQICPHIATNKNLIIFFFNFSVVVSVDMLFDMVPRWMGVCCGCCWASIKNSTRTNTIESFIIIFTYESSNTNRFTCWHYE